MPTGPCCSTSSQWRVSTSPGVTCLRKRAFLMPPKRASLPLILRQAERRHSAGLGQCFEDEDTGHDRLAPGKWPLKNSSLRVTHLRPMAHWPGS